MLDPWLQGSSKTHSKIFNFYLICGISMCNLCKLLSAYRQIIFRNTCKGSNFFFTKQVLLPNQPTAPRTTKDNACQHGRIIRGLHFRQLTTNCVSFVSCGIQSPVYIPFPHENVSDPRRGWLDWYLMPRSPSTTHWQTLFAKVPPRALAPLTRKGSRLWNFKMFRRILKM